MQHKSLEFAATADDTVDDKAREYITQGACHQEDAGIREENLELNHVISFFINQYFLNIFVIAIANV